jgi:hypothetical protein
VAEERPSFFILLGLDPDAPWDEGLFVRRREELKREWTRESRNFGSRPKTIEAKRNLDHMKQISVMASSAGREQERAKVRLARDAELARRRDELTQALRLTNAKGYLLRAEADRFWTDYAEVLAGDPHLRGELKRVEIRDTETGRQSMPELDVDTVSILTTNLGIVRARTLYDVLREVDENLTGASSMDRLRGAAKKLANRAHDIMDKSKPEVAAWNRLAGVAEMLFKTDQGRARYDQYVELYAVEQLLGRFEAFLSVAAAITAEQVELFLEEVRRAGVRDLDMARNRLVAYFGTKLWVIHLPDGEAVRRVASQLQCPYCAALNPPGARNCATCDFALDEPCSSCGRIEHRYGGCTCGFPTGHRPRVKDYLAEVRLALDEHDLHRADLELARAETIWRLPADSPDPLAADIRLLRARLDHRRHDAEAMRTRIDDLVRARRFVTAMELLRQAPIGLPRREISLAEAEKAVRGARERCRRARESGVPRDRRIELYSEALQICDDLEAARSELAAIPPAPPSAVRVEMDDPATGVLVSWDPSPDGDVTYVVMRGTGPAAPRSAEALPSQQRLGTVSATRLRDREAAGMPGMALRYVVLADRFGTYSAPAKARPIVVTTEAEVSADSADAGTILVGWRLPERAVGVHVTRVQIGVAGDPVLMAPTEPGRLADTDVQDGSWYRYLVRVAYENPEGGLIYSRGTSVDASATRPPTAPTGLSAVGVPSEFAFSRHRVQLRWPAPVTGSIRIVRQTGAGTLRDGDRRRSADIDRAGHVLTGTSPLIDRWIDPQMTVCTYAPVLDVDGFAYVGTPRRYADTAEVSGLSVEFAGRLVRLGWTWPEESVGVAIGYDATPPDDPTVAAKRLVVYRNDPGPAGECTLPIGSAFRTHLRVGSVVRRDNAEFVTAGVPLVVERPRLTVHYAVRDGRRYRELVLEVAEPTLLPALVLRGRVGGMPRSRDDGEAVLRLAAMRVPGRHAERLPRTVPAGMHFRLFTASAGDGGAVSLEPR